MTASARSSIGGSAQCSVLQHHDERPLGGEHLEQASHGPRSVGAERVADPEELRETVTDGRAVRLRGQPLAQVRSDPRLSRMGLPAA